MAADFFFLSTILELDRWCCSQRFVILGIQLELFSRICVWCGFRKEGETNRSYLIFLSYRKTVTSHFIIWTRQLFSIFDSPSVKHVAPIEITFSIIHSMLILEQCDWLFKVVRPHPTNQTAQNPVQRKLWWKYFIGLDPVFPPIEH